MLRRNARSLAVIAVAGLGFGAALAVGASGDDGVVACASKRSGDIRATTAARRCRPGEFAITISGNAFRRSGRGTITLNGMVFRRGSNRVLTINGTSFRGSSRGRTLTINGTTFRSRGKTLTINATEFAAGQRAAGPPGPAGPAGPPGSPGVPPGSPPTAVPGPVSATVNGLAASLASADFRNGDGVPHRVLVTGGFNAACNPCTGETVRSTFTLELGTGAGAPQVVRVLPDLSSTVGRASGTLSEIVVTPDVCGPCTYALSLRAQSAGGGSAATVDATGVRLGLVDLGPVAG